MLSLVTQETSTVQGSWGGGATFSVESCAGMDLQDAIHERTDIMFHDTMCYSLAETLVPAGGTIMSESAAGAIVH